MKKFRVYKISFKDWQEYEHEVNHLYENGEEIVDTLEKIEFKQLEMKDHIVLLKKCVVKKM